MTEIRVASLSELCFHKVHIRSVTRLNWEERGQLGGPSNGLHSRSRGPRVVRLELEKQDRRAGVAYSKGVEPTGTSSQLKAFQRKEVKKEKLGRMT